MGAAIMLPKVAFVAFAVAGVLSTAAVAGSPPNPGGFGQAVAANTDLARNFGSGPGASDWGATRADVAKGAYPGGNPGLNADAKAAQGANPTHGKP